MVPVYKKPSSLCEGVINQYCPGCMHATVVKLVAEVFDELELTGKSIMVSGVGCNGDGMGYLNVDFVAAPHGRACAVATGFKRCSPDNVVFTYQGDGDLASIGLAETMHAANRGENFVVIFINNALYGMTGGQMAPTTLEGMKTTTTPKGRDPQAKQGYPMHMCELLSSMKATAYIARGTCTTAQQVRKTKEYIKKAFQCQLDGRGFAMVEILSSCPSNWKMTPLQTLDYIDQHMIPEFPLGEFKTY